MKKSTIKKPSHITSAHVLDDLYLPKAVTAVEKIKYEIFRHIILAIEKKSLTAKEVQSILERPQPRVSELLNGKIAGMTIDMLITYVEKLGGEIDIKCKFKKIA